MTKPETLVRDCWCWAVGYRDGSGGTEEVLGGWAGVRAAEVAWLDLWPAAGGGVGFRVAVPEGAAAVFTRRRHVVALGPERRPWTLTIVGWRGPAGAAYLFASDDGQLFLTDDFYAEVGEG